MIRGRVVVGVTLLLGGLISPGAAEAQEATNIARIGYLAADLANGPHLPEAFRQGLRDLGYVVGRNLVIETRDAEGKRDRLTSAPNGWPLK
jgi:putative ABC transport system substrate-binding protein